MTVMWFFSPKWLSRATLAGAQALRVRLQRIFTGKNGLIFPQIEPILCS
jgi:hypothetical protein